MTSWIIVCYILLTHLIYIVLFSSTIFTHTTFWKVCRIFSSQKTCLALRGLWQVRAKKLWYDWIRYDLFLHKCLVTDLCHGHRLRRAMSAGGAAASRTREQSACRSRCYLCGSQLRALGVCCNFLGINQTSTWPGLKVIPARANVATRGISHKRSFGWSRIGL